MSHADFYDQVAELYDACVQADFDIPFFQATAQRANGPVLELMSGSGRVSLPLIQAGVPLTCVDFSAGLLAILQRKLDAAGLAADLHLMDVRELALDRQFALIFIPVHSFPEVTDPKSRTRTTNNRSSTGSPGISPRMAASFARCTIPRCGCGQPSGPMACGCASLCRITRGPSCCGARKNTNRRARS